MAVQYAIFALIPLYAILIFAIGVITSQCLTIIQGTEASERVSGAAATAKPSRFLPNFWGIGHPMDSRIWFALRDTQDLPDIVKRKARMIAWLYQAARLSFAATVFGLVILAW